MKLTKMFNRSLCRSVAKIAVKKDGDVRIYRIGQYGWRIIGS